MSAAATTQSFTAEQRAREDRRTTRLFARWRRHGDLRARDEIFAAHLPIARRLAGRYWNALTPIDDLQQVAGVGLLAAMERFEPERGVAFPTYAIPTILGELKRFFRNTGWSVHVPRSAQELAMRVENASRELETKLSRSPRVEEIAQYMELSTEDVLDGLAVASARHAASLDAPVRSVEDEALTLADSLGAIDERLDSVDLAVTVGSGLRHLSMTERHALALRLTCDLKQSEIARELGCSQMQVSRLLRSAAEKLREAGAGEL